MNLEQCKMESVFQTRFFAGGPPRLHGAGLCLMQAVHVHLELLKKNFYELALSHHEIENFTLSSSSFEVFPFGWNCLSQNYTTSAVSRRWTFDAGCSQMNMINPTKITPPNTSKSLQISPIHSHAPRFAWSAHIPDNLFDASSLIVTAFTSKYPLCQLLENVDGTRLKSWKCRHICRGFS